MGNPRKPKLEAERRGEKFWLALFRIAEEEMSYRKFMNMRQRKAKQNKQNNFQKFNTKYFIQLIQRSVRKGKQNEQRFLQSKNCFH